MSSTDAGNWPRAVTVDSNKHNFVIHDYNGISKFTAGELLTSVWIDDNETPLIDNVKNNKLYVTEFSSGHIRVLNS